MLDICNFVYKHIFNVTYSVRAEIYSQYQFLLPLDSAVV